MDLGGAQHATNLEGLFAAIHGIVGRLMEARNLYVALHDPVADLISYPYYVDEEDNPPGPSRRAGLDAYVLRNRQALLATLRSSKSSAGGRWRRSVRHPSIGSAYPGLRRPNTGRVRGADLHRGSPLRRAGEGYPHLRVAAGRLAIGRKRAEEQLQRSEQTTAAWWRMRTRRSSFRKKVCSSMSTLNGGALRLLGK